MFDRILFWTLVQVLKLYAWRGRRAGNQAAEMCRDACGMLR